MAPAIGSDVVHLLKNQLTVIIGFCDVLLAECPATDPRHQEVWEIHRAARAALALIPHVRPRADSDPLP